KSRAKYNEELGKQLRDFEKYTTDEATTKALLELQEYRKTIDEQNELIGKLRNQLKRLEDEKASAAKKIEEATNEALKVKKELLKTKTQNLFLQSVKSQDFDEVVSFLHHIGIGAKNIDTELKLFVKKLRKGKEISKNELLQKLDRILLENRKIISISRFASKANFQLFTSIVNIDLIGYITEYIENILGLIPSQDPNITVERGVNDIFELEIKPIEINIIIDNLISNSRRAKATQIIVSFDVKDNQLLVSFKDDGEGIKEQDLDKIFELGYTTTSGSGIGLYHIKNIMESLNGKIFVNKENNDFTEFILEINR
ncbi:MAG: ATP-binding protein, partial [Allomuricauda sp.]